MNEGEEPRYDDKAESKRLGQFHMSIPAEYGIRYVCFSFTRLCSDGDAYYRYRAPYPTRPRVDVTSGSCSSVSVADLLVLGQGTMSDVDVPLSLFYRVEQCIKKLNERQSHYFNGFSDKRKDLTMVSYRPSRWVPSTRLIIIITFFLVCCIERVFFFFSQTVHFCSRREQRRRRRRRRR